MQNAISVEVPRPLYPNMELQTGLGGNGAISVDHAILDNVTTAEIIHH
jgi:hypothetical protein